MPRLYLCYFVLTEWRNDQLFAESFNIDFSSESSKIMIQQNNNDKVY